MTKDDRLNASFGMTMVKAATALLAVLALAACQESSDSGSEDGGTSTDQSTGTDGTSSQ